MKYVLVLFAIMLFSSSVFKANADDNCPIDLWLFCIEGITLRYGVNQQTDEFGDIQCNPKYTVSEYTGEEILSDLGSCFWAPF